MARPKISARKQKIKRLNLRLNADEYATLQAAALADNRRAATWARETLLSLAVLDRRDDAEVETRPEPSLTSIIQVDPRLVREINAIGNNLNQIARAANRNQFPAALELLSSLLSIERSMAWAIARHGPRQADHAD